MSATYKAVGWNRQKKIYDIVMAGFVVLYLTSFITLMMLMHPEVTQETLIIRSTATLALLMLHIILAIGPLARLNPVFLPLLYNRRHLGVAMFLVAAVHGVFSVLQFHALGNVNPFVSLFTSNLHYGSYSKFPFEILGFFALIILLLMAVTSHDFWLHTLGPRTWKTLHMLVYVAYAFIVLHVLLGILQYETSRTFPLLLALGMVVLLTLHLVAGYRERTTDAVQPVLNEYIHVCSVKDIPDNRAKIVTAGSERVAIFKYDQKLSALSNVCKHQNGPLGEGRVIDGCVTCPWHGYQYLPHNGSSPPPFKERVAIYSLKIVGDAIWLNPTPHPEGTAVEPVLFPPAASEVVKVIPRRDEFYIGYLREAPSRTAFIMVMVILSIGLLTYSSAALLAWFQHRLANTQFEYGVNRTLHGDYFETPVPHLRIAVGKTDQGETLFQNVLLVGEGKSGASEILRQLEADAKTTFVGKTIFLNGNLIYGNGKAIFQVNAVPDDVQFIMSATAPPPWRSMGHVSVEGEIVDPKCYFGVMNPGEGKPHRSCAARCIAGGIPPVLHTTDDAYFLVVDENFNAVNTDVLALVGDDVTLAGEAVAWDDWTILKVKKSDLVALVHSKQQEAVHAFEQGLTLCSNAPLCAE